MSRPLCYLVEIIRTSRRTGARITRRVLKLDLRLLIGQAVRIRSSGSLPAVNVIPLKRQSALKLNCARDFA